ncbi:hypothetical protein ACFL1Q_00360 [Patescibacteria group bacterium]
MRERCGESSDSDLREKNFIKKSLRRFLKKPGDWKQVSKLLDQGKPHHNIFRIISFKKGKGKLHASGKTEGKMKGS